MTNSEIVFYVSSDGVYPVHDKVLVSDDSVRKSLENAIYGMKLVGGTCLGNGLLGGMDVRNGGQFETVVSNLRDFFVLSASKWSR